MLSSARKILEIVRFCSTDSLPDRERARDLESKLSLLSLESLVSAFILGEYYLAGSDPMSVIAGAIHWGYADKIDLTKVLGERRAHYANIALMLKRHAENATKAMTNESELDSVVTKYLHEYFYV